jgi:tetratricopeptide (TPR) repeat protein
LVLVLVIGGCETPTPPAQQGSMTRAHAICDGAEVLISEDKYEAAIGELNKAIQVDQRCIVAAYLLGWIYATCPEPQFRDGRKAIHYAEMAIEVDRHFDRVGAEDNRAQWMGPACLAAAYAEAGDYEKAIKAVNDALELVQHVPVEDRGVRMQELVESRLRAVLKLYQAGKPLRTHKTALSKLSDDWAEAILDASDKSQYPDLAE